jgi:nucleoside-triphosphatase THEP1
MGRLENNPLPFSKVILLTGPREIGKTRLLLKLLDEFQDRSLRINGVISPAVFAGSEKIAIELMDVRLRERKRLAELRQDDSSGLMTNRWVFDTDTLDWGNNLFAGATPCDLLIVDELGPIELEKGQGLQNGIHAISGNEYKAAVVVIRPELLHAASHLWPGSSVFTATGNMEEDLRLLTQKIICFLTSKI